MSGERRPARMPYIGLRPFDEDDEQVFFGRERQVNAMLGQLEEAPFLAVVGASGSGKSSLVRAGLLPAISQGFLLGATKWAVTVFRPGHQPYDRLVAGLSTRRSPTSQGDTTEDALSPELAEVVLEIRSSDRGIVDALSPLGISDEEHVLIVVDQFEELFGFRRAHVRSDPHASRDEAAGFVRTLLNSVRQSNGRVHVVITMRSDFIGHADAFLGLPEAISASQFLVPRLDRHQMEEAIVNPSRLRNAGYQPFEIDPHLVNRIINQAGDRMDQLPLMQHALMRSWKLASSRAPHRGGKVRITLDDYEDVGGIEEALSRHADGAWEDAKKTPTLDRITREVFLLLCDISPDGQITRRRPTVAEVCGATGATAEQLRAVLRLFQEDDRNFLSPPHASALGPDTTLDISHESLIRQWAKFDAWRTEEAERAGMFRRLCDGAQRHRAGQESHLTGPSLSNAVAWLEDESNGPSAEWAERYGGGLDEVLDFIEESRDALAAEQRKEAKRKAKAILVPLLAAGSVVLVVAAGVFGYIALSGRRIIAAQTAEQATLQQERVALEKKITELDESYAAEERRLNEFLQAIRVTAEAREKEYAATAAGLKRQVDGLERERTRLSTERQNFGRVSEAGAVVAQVADGLGVTFLGPDRSPDPVLPHLPAIGTIRAVDLKQTRVTDQGLASLQRIPTVRSLDLSSTDVGDGGVSLLAGLPELRSLALAGTLVTERSFPVFHRLKLESLDISRTRISEESVRLLRDDLTGTSVTYSPDPLLRGLARHGTTEDGWQRALLEVNATANTTANGRSVKFSGSAITDAALKALSDFDEIEIDSCREITPDGLRSLARHPRLRKVTIRKVSKANDEGIQFLSQNPTLKELVLEEIPITDESLKSIARIRGLESLRVAGVRLYISGDGLEALEPLQSLARLSIESRSESAEGFEVTQGALDAISRLPALRHLSLQGISLGSGVDLSVLEHLRSLETLNLARAKGDPETFQGLTALKTIHDLFVQGAHVPYDLLMTLRAVPGLQVHEYDDLGSLPFNPGEQELLRATSTGGRILELDAAVPGRLDATSPLVAGRRVLAWDLAPCARGTSLQVDLSSSDFDPVLIVQDEATERTLYDDDGGGGSSSRLVITCRDARHKVLVGSLPGLDPDGAFVLRTRRVTEVSGDEGARKVPADDRVLRLGDTVREDLQNSSWLVDGQHALAWTLEGCNEASVQLHLKSATFAPYLIVVDRDTDAVHRSDNFVYGLDSQLVLPCTAGGYTVIATAMYGSGAFELSANVPMTLRDLVPTNVLTRGRSVRGRLTMDADVVEGRRVVAWSMEGCAPGERVRVDLESEHFDPFLVVVDRGSGEILYDDDSGGDLDARLVLGCSHAGYIVIASAVLDYETGDFELTARRLR